MAALMWPMGGFGPMPHQLSHFLTVKNEADRRYGIERYSKETRRRYGVLDQRLGQSIADLKPSCLWPGAVFFERKRLR